MAALTPQPFRPDSHQSHRPFLPALFRHASEGKRRDPRQAVAAERPSARTKSRIPHCVCSAQRSLRTRRRDQESHDRFGDSDGLRRRQPGVHTATEAQDQTGARRRSFEQRGGGGQDRAEDDTAATILHRNFNTWSSVPPKYLKWLLSEAEPVSLSKYSMRAITTPGAREPPKEPMLQMLEFMAHISRDAPIGEQRQLSALAEFISRKNVECGRKLREATLPLDWASSGWFLMEWGVEKSTAHLTHRFNGDDLRIKLNVKPGTFPTLQNNYSLGKASVAYTNTSGAGERDNIQQMFVEAGLGMRLKVFDGSVKEKPEASEENKDPLVDAKYDPDDLHDPEQEATLGRMQPIRYNRSAFMYVRCNRDRSQGRDPADTRGKGGSRLGEEVAGVGAGEAQISWAGRAAGGEAGCGEARVGAGLGASRPWVRRRAALRRGELRAPRGAHRHNLSERRRHR